MVLAVADGDMIQEQRNRNHQNLAIFTTFKFVRQRAVVHGILVDKISTQFRLKGFRLTKFRQDLGLLTRRKVAKIQILTKREKVARLLLNFFPGPFNLPLGYCKQVRCSLNWWEACRVQTVYSIAGKNGQKGGP